jgi:phage terminase large subunit
MAVLMDAIAQCLTIPNWTCLILRRTLPELEQSHIMRFRSIVPEKLYKWSEQKKIATLFNGSTIRFGYCEIKGDETRYQGDQYGAIYFDETTHFEMHPWTYLGIRNRSTAGGRPNMSGASNPGNRGHAWVKALWIDRKPAPGMEAHEYNAEEYEFIPAKLTDNPHLLQKNPEYLKSLESLPVALRIQMLDGSWDVHAGQYFDTFDREKHVTHDCLLEQWYPRFIGIDYGYKHSFAVYWGAERPDGKRVIYRELVGQQKPVNEIAELIATLSMGEKIDAVYLSPDAWAKRSEERSIKDRFYQVFSIYRLPEPTMATNDRVNGWRYLHDLFSNDNVEIHFSCKGLIEKIPQAIYDDRPGHEEDVMKFVGDDELDAFRYTLMSRPRTPIKPFLLRLAEMVTSLDPTSRAIQVRLAKRKLELENIPFAVMGRHSAPRMGQRA